MMTPEQLAEIEARVAAAELESPGLWVNMGENDVESAFWGEIRNTDTFSQLAIMPEADDRTATFNLMAYAKEDIPALLVEVKRLQDGIAKIEARWREASQDKCFRSHYRGTMAECADELKSLLDGVDDSELEAEIDKAFNV